MGEMCIYHGIRIVQSYKSSCAYYTIRLAMEWGMDETLDHRQSDQSSLTLFSAQVIGCTTYRATPSRKRLRIFEVNRRRLLHAKNVSKVRHRQPAYGEECCGQVDDGVNTPYTEWADFGQQPRTTLFPLSPPRPSVAKSLRTTFTPTTNTIHHSTYAAKAHCEKNRSHKNKR